MEWERITPQSGMRGGDRPNLTISLRTPAKGGRPKVTLTIGVDLSRRLEWKAKQRVHVDLARSAGLLRLATTTDARDSYSLHQAGGGNVLESTFSLLGLDSETRKAEPVEHRVEAGALLVTLPEWARLPVHDVQEPPEPEPEPTVPAMPGSALAMPGSALAMPDSALAMPDSAPAMHGSALAVPDKAPPPKWTAERKAVLRDLYLANASTADIVARLNALPGEPVKGSDAIAYAQAGLKLPTKAAMAAAAAAAQADPPAPPPVVVQPAPTAVPTAAQEPEVRRMRASGYLPDAIARRLGLPLDQVEALDAAATKTAREMIGFGAGTDQICAEAGLPPKRVMALRMASKGRAA